MGAVRGGDGGGGRAGTQAGPGQQRRSAGGGGGGGGADAGGGETGGAEAGGGEAGGELPALEEEKDADLSTLEEETREERERGIRPSQKGKKEEYTSAHTKNFGEDPLGNKENKEKSKTERRTRHIYKGSPIGLDEDLKNITASLRTKYNNKQKKVITEEKSILDESNLIQDDKPL